MTDLATILEAHDLATTQNTGNSFWTSKLRKKIQAGKRVKIFYNQGNPSNRVLHVLGIVDNDYIVCKQWSKRKQDWYSVEHIYYFWLHFESTKSV